MTAINPRAFATVISHYAARGTADLEILLEQMRTLCDRIIIVVNEDYPGQFYSDKPDLLNIVVRRENSGMNIGAWSQAILKLESHIDWVLFLQDECRLVDSSFVNHYGQLLQKDVVGMVGELINPKWDRPWAEIPDWLNYEIDSPKNGGRIRRREFYLSCLNRWGIRPGSSARHLRALIWAFRTETLSTLRHFPIGGSKEECIAAEIAVSRQIEGLGLSVIQSDEIPFRFFRHTEWASSGVGKSS